MVSMKEIAKKCNVSVASVSKAMNGYSDISEETRKLIMKTASEMGYLPNSSARTLKTKRSYNIGVMFVDEAASGLTHDYFNHVLNKSRTSCVEYSTLDAVRVGFSIIGEIALYFNCILDRIENISVLSSIPLVLTY